MRVPENKWMLLVANKFLIQLANDIQAAFETCNKIASGVLT